MPVGGAGAPIAPPTVLHQAFKKNLRDKQEHEP
jgi:hypothetical protein